MASSARNAHCWGGSGVSATGRPLFSLFLGGPGRAPISTGSRASDDSGRHSAARREDRAGSRGDLHGQVRAGFRMRRFTAGDLDIMVTSSGTMGGGRDEAGSGRKARRWLTAVTIAAEVPLARIFKIDWAVLL